jgi:hypothetical protein
MDDVKPLITIMLAVIGAVGMVIIVRNRLHAMASDHRMYRMMLTCGIGEATARNANRLLDIDMQDARRRCQRCRVTETCDRWLNGEAVPGNDFCPNAARFMAAAETSQRRVTYDRAKRPGRRLDN